MKKDQTHVECGATAVLLDKETFLWHQNFLPSTGNPLFELKLVLSASRKCPNLVGQTPSHCMAPHCSTASNSFCLTNGTRSQSGTLSSKLRGSAKSLTDTWTLILCQA